MQLSTNSLHRSRRQQCIPMSRRRDKNLTPNCPPKQHKQFRIYIYGQSEFNEIMKRFVEVIQDWNKLSTQNYGKKRKFKLSVKMNTN
jgi:hypothetical protein